MSSQFRYDGRVQDIVGNAIAGASIAVLTQPAVTTTQPGSPLATIFNAATSNAFTLTGASWSSLTAQLTLVVSGSVPSDVVPGSFVNITTVNPAGYNGIWQVVSVSGLNVVVTTPYTLAAIANPGSYVSSTASAQASSALTNPFFTDTLGNFKFYSASGVFTVQIYDTLSRITPLVLIDQNVVAGGGAGSVTSVALTVPAEFTVSGSPVTASGTLAVTKATELANTVWAGPTSGGAVAPTFRLLVAADMPAGTGTVTSVAHTLAVPASIMTAAVVGSPITTSGTLADTISLINQNQNTVWAGPSSGAPALPAFRTLVAQDLPNVTVTLSSANILALLGTPITLVAAQGVGFAIIPELIVIKFFGSGAAYTDAGGAVQFVCGSAIVPLVSNAIFLVTVSPNRRIQSFPWPGATDTAGNPPSDDNAPLQINKLTNNFAAGTGTATILVFYNVVPTT